MECVYGNQMNCVLIEYVNVYIEVWACQKHKKYLQLLYYSSHLLVSSMEYIYAFHVHCMNGSAFFARKYSLSTRVHIKLKDKPINNPHNCPEFNGNCAKRTKLRSWFDMYTYTCIYFDIFIYNICWFAHKFETNNNYSWQDWFDG